MAISRQVLLLFCIGTLLFNSVFTNAKQTKHENGCENGSNLEKGNQCQDKEDESEFDDDFDDTYKIVNNIRVSLSLSGDKVPHEDFVTSESSEEDGNNHSDDIDGSGVQDDPNDLDMDRNDRVIVVGH